MESAAIASHSEDLQIEGSDMNLYLSLPEGSDSFPAVVVSHHGAGIDRFIKETSDRLAGEGYAVAAPNFYHRITHDMLSDASRHIQHLRDPLTVNNLNTTIGFLRGHPSALGQPIGITGFCLGSRTTFLAAAYTSHFSAVAPYYGGNFTIPHGRADKTPFELVGNISCPVLFRFGEIDQNPCQAEMATLDAELTGLRVDHAYHTYQNATYTFMDYAAHRYNKAAAPLSRPRTLAFSLPILRPVSAAREILKHPFAFPKKEQTK